MSIAQRTRGVSADLSGMSIVPKGRVVTHADVLLYVRATFSPSLVGLVDADLSDFMDNMVLMIDGDKMVLDVPRAAVSYIISLDAVGLKLATHMPEFEFMEDR